jgi:hypothetical protein
MRRELQGGLEFGMETSVSLRPTDKASKEKYAGIGKGRARKATANKLLDEVERAVPNKYRLSPSVRWRDEDTTYQSQRTRDVFDSETMKTVGRIRVVVGEKLVEVGFQYNE